MDESLSLLPPPSPSTPSQKYDALGDEPNPSTPTPTHQQQRRKQRPFTTFTRAHSFLSKSPLSKSPAEVWEDSDGSSQCKLVADAGGLPPSVRIGYALGHAQNDLCAAMYFSYLLVYLEGTGLSPVDAGTVLIVGQVVDGCATPLVGMFSDRYRCLPDSCCWGRSGRRKSWYAGGLAMVTMTFWMLFTPFPVDAARESGTTAAPLDPVSPVVYYAVVNSLFQIGWATVQVSHMSMVPEMTPILSERCYLNSIRYAVTVGTSIAVYVLVALFSAAKNADGATAADEQVETTAKVGASLQDREETDLLRMLQEISYVVLFAGALMGFAFFALVSENRGRDASSENASSEQTGADKKISALDDGDAVHLPAEDDEEDVGPTTPPKTIYDWLFRTPGFFGVVSNYAFSRLCVNVIQIYLPFYVLYAMPERPSALATVPLTAYVGMILSSAAAPRASSYVRDAAWLCIGATAILSAGCLELLLLSDPREEIRIVFSSSAILGFGGAQLMVASQTQVCELVGSDPNGGVVFGISSLCDKVSTGAVIYCIQRLVQELTTSSAVRVDGAVPDGNSLERIYQYTTAGGPIVCALLACLALLTVPSSIRDREGSQK